MCVPPSGAGRGLRCDRFAADVCFAPCADNSARSGATRAAKQHPSGRLRRCPSGSAYSQNRARRFSTKQACRKTAPLPEHRFATRYRSGDIRSVFRLRRASRPNTDFAPCGARRPTGPRWRWRFQTAALCPLDHASQNKRILPRTIQRICFAFAKRGGLCPRWWCCEGRRCRGLC